MASHKAGRMSEDIRRIISGKMAAHSSTNLQTVKTQNAKNTLFALFLKKKTNTLRKIVRIDNDCAYQR